MKRNKAAEDLLRPLVEDLNRKMRRAEEEAVLADPENHKTTRIGIKEGHYRYWTALDDEHGRKVRFCYTTMRNMAGYFLCFKEVRDKETGFRDQWSARKLRRACKEKAERMRDRHNEKIRQAALRRGEPDPDPPVPPLPITLPDGFLD